MTRFLLMAMISAMAFQASAATPTPRQALEIHYSGPVRYSAWRSAKEQSTADLDHYRFAAPAPFYFAYGCFGSPCAPWLFGPGSIGFIGLR